MGYPVMVKKIDFATASGYTSLHTLKFFDSSNRALIISNLKVTTANDYRKASFTVKGISGNIIQDTYRTSATGTGYPNILNLFNYTAPEEYEMYKMTLTFAQPLLLTGLTIRGACDSTSTQKTFTIKVSPHPAWGVISSGNITPAKVDGSKPASYSTHSFMFTKMPIIKAYKVPETGVDEQKYLFLMPKKDD